MRHRASTTLLAFLAIADLVAGFLRHQSLFFVLAAGALALLALSLVGVHRPPARTLRSFAGHRVRVELWGSPPPASAPRLVLESVNVLGAGLHVFFTVPGAGAVHLKVAQPAGLIVTSDQVIIESARYIQWQRERLPVVPAACALWVVREEPLPGRPGTGACPVVAADSRGCDDSETR
jgi:hypothetical protein